MCCTSEINVNVNDEIDEADRKRATFLIMWAICLREPCFAEMLAVHFPRVSLKLSVKSEINSTF
jgi:hypothetical protein